MPRNDDDDGKTVKQGNTFEEGNKKIPAKEKINRKGNEKKNEEKIEGNEKKNEEKKEGNEIKNEEKKIEKRNENKFDEIYREQEGPHLELESGHAAELGYDGFYLGMTWHEWIM
jgi:hypothetical protein